MALMPAICLNGHITTAPIQVDKNVTFEDVTTDCHLCDADAIVPSGTYDLVDNAVRVAQGHTPNDLQKLVGILEAVDSDASPDEVAATLEAADPAFAPFAALIREIRKHWRYWLMILVTLFGTDIRKAIVGRPIPPTDQVIERLAKEIQQQSQSSKDEPLRVEKVGRNQPCPCGSGKKFKHCHGRPAVTP